MTDTPPPPAALAEILRHVPDPHRISAEDFARAVESWRSEERRDAEAAARAEAEGDAVLFDE